MALFDFIKDIAGLASAATGVAGMFGLGQGGASNATQQLAQRQASIAEALANPSSPMFQQARQQAMEQSRTAQLQALRDYMTAQQRQARRFAGQGGATSVYAMNPRRDEAIARQLAAMGQNEQARADAAARAQLTGAAQSYGSAAQGMANAAALGQQQRTARLAGLIGGLEGLGEIATGLPKAYARGMAAFESPVQSMNQPTITSMAAGQVPAQTMYQFKGFR